MSNYPDNFNSAACDSIYGDNTPAQEEAMTELMAYSQFKKDMLVAFELMLAKNGWGATERDKAIIIEAMDEAVAEDMMRCGGVLA